MLKFLVGGTAAALVAVTPALAGNVQGQAGNRQQMMNKTETRAEVQGHVAQMFAKLDANKDGFISSAEMTAVEAKRIESKMEQRAAQFDPAKAFARLDSNKDGKLTKAEVQAARPGAKSGQGVDKFFARVDTNRDGVVSLAEMKALPKPTFDKGKIEQRLEGKGHMLGKADINKDGKVSLAEAQQVALARFDRADSNHDGKVTPQERKAAMPAMRTQPKG